MDRHGIRIDFQCEKTAEVAMRFAAEELERYLGRMLPGVTEDILITLGLMDRQEDPKNDSIVVEMKRNGGKISGSNTGSVLIGVYDYLQTIGCRFLAPGKCCEWIPVIDQAKLKAAYEKHASFPYRGVCIEGADSYENVSDFIDWLPKVGFNSFFLQFKIPYSFLNKWYRHINNPFLKQEEYTIHDARIHMKRLEREMQKRSLRLHKAGHGWTGEILGYETLDWDRDSHPLSAAKKCMAAMVNGERALFHGVAADTNLCLGQEKNVEAFADEVVKYAGENPDVDYLHVWLADAFNNVCECEKCAKSTPSDQYVHLLNVIDHKLSARGLETKIVFLLYQELLWPPVHEKIENEKRFALMFAPISRTFEHSYDMEGVSERWPEYVRNRITLPVNLSENLAFLRGWKQCFSGDGFVYDYPLGRAHYGDFGYLHIAQVISEDIKKLDSLGLDGYVSCQELRVNFPNALPDYVMGHTLFQKEASLRELTAEYYQAAYGDRAEEVLEYLGKLSVSGGCDYVNGKGSRADAEIAERMEALQDICLEMRSRIKAWKNSCTGIKKFWEILEYHNHYILLFSKALALLAAGENEEAKAAYSEMKKYICEKEPDFQPWFDVYRVIEVTGRYTGFGE